MAVRGRLRCHENFFVAVIDASRPLFQPAAEAPVFWLVPRADVVRAAQAAVRSGTHRREEPAFAFGGPPRGSEPLPRCRSLQARRGFAFRCTAVRAKPHAQCRHRHAHEIDSSPRLARLQYVSACSSCFVDSCGPCLADQCRRGAVKSSGPKKPMLMIFKTFGENPFSSQ